MRYSLVAVALLLALTGVCFAPGALCDDAVVVEGFDGPRVPETLEATDAKAGLNALEGGKRALQVEFGKASRPGVVLNAPEGAWDWSEFAGVAVDVVNPAEKALDVFMRVDSTLKDGKTVSARGSMTLEPGKVTTFPFFFTNYGAGPYWGMRGIPVRGPVVMYSPGMAGFTLEASNVNAIRLYLNQPETEHTLLIDDIRVFKAGSPEEHIAAFPFVDAFGQYKHADWPGKVHEEGDLQKQRAQEEAALAAEGTLPGRDRFGGWADGPQLEATGWFRVEKVDGKWWFVTPEGHLFFSLGMDCVDPGNSTFVTGREAWFEWAPEANGSFADFLGSASGVHSMAEPIKGTGTTVNFYGVNQKRTYGDDWQQGFRDTAYKRLQAWGFNTIGNWSDGEVLEGSPVPFVVTGGSGGGRAIEASEGFWGRMVDVFDPSFVEGTEKRLGALAASYAQNPMVLGYFVDNEMSWKGIPAACLASPVDQPARVALVDDLKAKYGTIEKLNEVWGTNAADWEALRVPRRPTEACTRDLSAFEYRFGRMYFETVRDALRKHAPNQLYMGCRFTLMYCPDAVMKACAEVVDVVSINAYLDAIQPEMYSAIDRPVVIGEFHFGALDRGMFHPGLGASKNQVDRSEKYVHFVKSVADNPCFVGCHWFQYTDQPNTGRYMDGENYNIGFVSITDTPYAELVEAAKGLHREIYGYRYGKK